MLPAPLHERDLRIGEVGDGSLEEIGRGDEVGVEDGDQLAFCETEPVRQGASFEIRGGEAPELHDVEACLTKPRHDLDDDPYRLVVRVIQSLDLEQLARIVERRSRLDRARRRIVLIPDGDLDRDPGPARGWGWWRD